MLATLGLTLVFGGAFILRYYGYRTRWHRHYTALCQPPAVEKTDLVFKGTELRLSDGELHRMLEKRFPYYRSLLPQLKRRFIKRLRLFMRRKIFIIKDDKGFKDRPVLVSAAAVQLTFGLKHYRLPFYKYIRIYPTEYFAEHEIFKVLTGNVKNNVISVAWNHLLSGYAGANDGSNVALHEMSHALYIQRMIIDKDFSGSFIRKYAALANCCKQAYKMETADQKNMYSDYGETDLQEFWAESVELFFEKPQELRAAYPGVYEAMKLLLNQDPLRPEEPLLQKSVRLAAPRLTFKSLQN